MKIIGHRGAAGSELENTLASIEIALNLGVDAIEFDVRRTRDNKLVLCHDADLGRISDSRSRIEDLTLKQLQKIPLLTGAHVPSLAEALEVTDNTEVFIELKEHGSSQLLIDELAHFPKAQARVVSFKLDELTAFRVLSNGKIPVYGLEKTRPFDIIHLARALKLDGVGLNYWLLNPLTYYLCKRAGISIYVWTVNNPFQARFLSKLYPDVAICSDYPERFVRQKGSPQ